MGEMQIANKEKFANIGRNRKLKPHETLVPMLKVQFNVS